MRKSYNYIPDVIVTNKNELIDAVSHKKDFIVYTMDDAIEVRTALRSSVDKAFVKALNAVVAINGSYLAVSALEYIASASFGVEVAVAVGGAFVARKLIGIITDEDLDKYDYIVIPTGEDSSQLCFIQKGSAKVFNPLMDTFSYQDHKIKLIEKPVCPFCKKKFGKEFISGTCSCGKELNRYFDTKRLKKYLKKIK